MDTTSDTAPHRANAPTDGVVLMAAVQRIYCDSLTIAIGFAQGYGYSAELHRQATVLRNELRLLATTGASDDPEQQRMLSTAELDLSYVTSGGKRPHSTRLAHLRSSSE
jgi:hypothetical protein